MAINEHFYRVTIKATCIEAIQSALAAGQPTLIEAMIDPTGYPTTPQSLNL